MGYITPITSSTNDSFKLWKSLGTSKGIKKEGLCLLSGEKLVREFLKNKTLEIVAELIPAGHQPVAPEVKGFELSKLLFNELDELGTHFNILVLKIPVLSTWSAENPYQGLQMICPLGDPGNLGALIRSAEAFGVSNIVLTQESANPFLPKVIKASAGSVLKLPLLKGPSLQDMVSSSATNDFVALDLDGESIKDWVWPKQCRLIVGEEGPGLSKALSSTNLKNPESKAKKIKTIFIPTTGVESLNAVVAASVALYDYASKSKN